MKKHKEAPAAGASPTLRQRAEQALAARPAPAAAIQSRDVERTLHELQVHQIELEMQNDDLRAAQLELDASRARYFDLYDLAPVSYVALSDKGLILEANLTAASLFAVPRTALVGRTLTNFIFAEDQDRWYRLRRQLVETGAPQSGELRLLRPETGAAFWAQVSATMAPDAAGAPVCRVVLNDISERKRQEAVLRFLAQSGNVAGGEDFFAVLARYLAETLDMDFICIDRLEGDGLMARTVAVWCDGHFEDNVTYALKDTPCGDVVGKTVCCFPASVCQFFPRDVVLQDLRAESYIGVTLWGHTGQPIGLIAVIGRRPLANRELAESVLQMVAVRAAGELERQQAEAQLRASAERHRSILQTAMAGFWLADTQGRLLEVNETYCRMSGYSEPELLAMHISDLEAAETRDQAAAHLQTIVTRGEDHFESRHRRQDGSVFDVEVSAQYRPADGGHFVAFLRDISEHKQAEAEREKLQAQLAQSQKLESIGRLAGGVAHDFNNKLQVILGIGELLLADADPDDPLVAELNEIQAAARHSADLTRQLLAFARKQTIVPKVLDLNDTLAGMFRMLKRLIGEDIELIWRPGADPAPVNVDPSQLDQILANLAVNARDAIAGVGRVTVETGNVELNADDCRVHPDAIPGAYVLLAVSDTGCGMDPETQAHIFEPFFTTKELGRGTGLGLATVYGIVKQNNGVIDVTSEPGKGTTFRIYLPQYVAPALEAAAEARQATAPTGTETVLLVEDEVPLLRLASRLLKRLGYTVLATDSPQEAIRVATEYAGEIHLLLTDVVMPQMSGHALWEQLSPVRPGMKCLFMSGYTADDIAHRGALDAGLHFIQKPFAGTALAGKVREVLEEKTP